MINLIKSLVLSGVSAQTERELAKHIALTNGLTLTIWFFIVPFSFIFYFLGYEELGILLPFMTIPFIPVIYLNRKGHTLASRLVLVVMMNIILGSYAIIIGRDSGVHLLFFVFVGIPFLIYSLNQWLMLAIGVSLSAGFFYLVQFGPIEQFRDDGAGMQSVVYFAMITLIMLWTTMNFIYFSVASKSNEDKIVAEKEKFSNLVDHAPDAMLFCDRKGQIQLVNRRFRECMGFTSGEIVGKEFREVVATGEKFTDQVSWVNYCNAIVNVSRASIIEQLLKRKDGTDFPAELSVIRLEGDSGSTISISLRDITERKQLELLKILSAESLTRNKELEQFAYVVSHDLKSPVVSAMQLIGMLRKDIFTDESKEVLNILSASIVRMHSLINDLLRYSLTGKEGEWTTVNCSAVVEEVKQDLASVIDQASAELKVGDLPEIHGHPTAMRSLFQNLVSNAIKFRKPGKPPVVEISSERVNGQWKFAVRDNGIGIDPKYSEKIFEVFQRLNESGSYEGNGIGLAQCKKIIDHHGGNIWVESSPGNGSTFYFTIEAS